MSFRFRGPWCVMVGCALTLASACQETPQVDEENTSSKHAALLAPKVDPQIGDWAALGSTPIRVLATYNQPPAAKHQQQISALGGQVVASWDRGVWTMLAVLPPRAAIELAKHDGDLVAVELDGGGSGSIMNAMVQLRTRGIAAGSVDGVSLTGQGQTIAIMDSGIDPTHADLSGRIVGWQDFSGPEGDSPGAYLAPIDPWGHGTGVSAIAGSSGAGAPGDTYSITASRRFQAEEGQANIVSFSARGSAARISVLLDPLESLGGTHGIDLLDDNRSRLDRVRSTADPLEVTFEGLDILSELDTTNFALSFYASSIDDIATGGTPYEAQITAPFDPIDDRPLTVGAAPEVGLYGLKVLDDQGNFSSATPILSALSWLYDNGTSEGIGIVNASLNFSRGGGNTAVDGAVDRLVRDTGIIFVASARNGQNDGVAVSSPATAEMAVAVGAINLFDQVTSYSSTGGLDEPFVKPDLVAPGGSNGPGRIVTADSNSAVCKSFARDDCVFEEDRFENDYRTYTGTSFAAPHVSGVLALLMEADGGHRSGSTEQFQTLTALLKMTATEVGSGESATPGPAGRAARLKDPVEGFGRMNPQAAVEALTLFLDPLQNHGEVLDGEFGGRRSWARRVVLEEGVAVEIALSSPPNGDFDLYLFGARGDARGEPVLLASTTRPMAGSDERLFFVSNTQREAIVVVKRVSGEGGFELRVESADDLCLAPGRERIGEPCRVGVGLCASEGVLACGPSLDSLVCDATVGVPSVELCGSGVDEDCDGVADEGFDLLGSACEAGIGACRRGGAIVCDESGLEQLCSARPGEPSEELCGDGRDNDCDGETDEGYADESRACEVGVGACTNRSVLVCGGDRLSLVCPVEPLEPSAESCGDAVDNDCDGETDEGFEALGKPCSVGAGKCAVSGELVCGPGGDALVCDAAPDLGCEEDEGCQAVSGFAGRRPMGLGWVLLLMLGLILRRGRGSEACRRQGCSGYP